MKLVKFECPNCKGKLEINPELKIFHCNYCGASGAIDDEVKKVEVKVKNSKYEEALQELEETKKYCSDEDFYAKALEMNNKYPKSKEIEEIFLSSINKMIAKYMPALKEIGYFNLKLNEDLLNTIKSIGETYYEKTKDDKYVVEYKNKMKEIRSFKTLLKIALIFICILLIVLCSSNELFAANIFILCITYLIYIKI